MSVDENKITIEGNEKKVLNEDGKQVCGIVMPISEIDGLSKSHWDEVYNIISESIVSAGFKPNLVSNSEDIGVIQKRIVQNLYENPIVVCDVSAKNPNVMFELGLRLAFDKPTIIIKDDKTNYSFDTSPIEHLEYPRDLRFSKIRDFGDKLANKIDSTYRKSIDDKEYSTFLKHFGTFKVAKIETEVVTKEDLIMEEVRSIRNLILRDINNKNTNDKNIRYTTLEDVNFEKSIINVTLKKSNKNNIAENINKIISLDILNNITIVKEDSEIVVVSGETKIQIPKNVVYRILSKTLEDNLVSIK